MKMQNNKTKIATTILGTLAIALVLLSPMTVLPNISAQPQGEIREPAQAIQFQEHITEQIKLHRGWVGVLSWNATGATIHYLGPANKNPYHRGVEAGTCSPPCQQAAAQITPTSYPNGGSNTQPAEIDSSFTAKASTNSYTDLLMDLNGWDGSGSDWLQSVLLYNIAGEGGLSSNTWYAEMDAHDSSGNEESGYPMSLSVTVNSQTDSFAEHLYELGSGCYEAAVDDSSSSNGYTFSECFTNDNASYFQLTYKNPNGYADSGPMTEDSSTDNTQTYHWGSIVYNIGLRNTVLGTQYTSVNGWTSNNGASGDATGYGTTPTISTSNTPAKVTMSY
ncbi:MAG: hypothetical protein ACREBI_11515 [Nitrosotalea sp.]